MEKRFIISQTPFSGRNVFDCCFIHPSQCEYEQKSRITIFPSSQFSQLCFLCQRAKITSYSFSSHYLLGLFLPSSVVPGVRRIPTGSGTRQDDAGGLSTSSTRPLKAVLLGNIWNSDVQIQESRSVVPPQSSRFCKWLICSIPLFDASSGFTSPFFDECCHSLVTICCELQVCRVPPLTLYICSPAGPERVWPAH